MMDEDEADLVLIAPQPFGDPIDSVGIPKTVSTPQSISRSTSSSAAILAIVSSSFRPEPRTCVRLGGNVTECIPNREE